MCVSVWLHSLDLVSLVDFLLFSQQHNDEHDTKIVLREPQKEHSRKHAKEPQLLRQPRKHSLTYDAQCADVDPTRKAQIEYYGNLLCLRMRFSYATSQQKLCIILYIKSMLSVMNKRLCMLCRAFIKYTLWLNLAPLRSRRAATLPSMCGIICAVSASRCIQIVVIFKCDSKPIWAQALN